jgi:lipid A 3-O-deacylase
VLRIRCHGDKQNQFLSCSRSDLVVFTYGIFGIGTMRVVRGLAAVRMGVSAMVVLILAGGAAHAQSPSDWQAGSLVDEVRAGVLKHDVRFAGGREPGADISAELLFASPFPQDWGASLPGWLTWVARPRPFLGGELNTAGATNQVYAGLTWTVPLSRRVLSDSDSLTLDLDFGPGLNDGHVRPTTPDRKALGSNALFRLAAELGWHFTSRVGVYLLFEHVSNAGLTRYNEGLNDFGLRVGYRF